MKFYEYEVRGTMNVKFWQKLGNAVEFASQDTIDFYKGERGVELELYMTDVPVHETSVNLYFRKKNDKETYVVSYIHIRETED